MSFNKLDATNFDATKEIILSCDASQKGIGAVISHVIDGVERPISCASRSLTTAERGYSQLEREALAVVYGKSKSSITTSTVDTLS